MKSLLKLMIFYNDQFVFKSRNFSLIKKHLCKHKYKFSFLTGIKDKK